MEDRKAIQIPDQEQFTPSQVSALLGLHRNTIYYWLDEGKLPSQPGFFGGRVIFRADLAAFIRQYLGREVAP